MLSQRATAAAAAGYPAGRAATATQLVGDWRSGAITLDLAIDHAHRLLDDRVAGSTVYAGAVLDLALAIEDRIPDGPATSTFLLMRIGRLAFKAAERAASSGRLAEAESLMLAGPARWRSEAYWRRYGDHDALVAIVMTARGDRSGAIRRLESRAVLDDTTEAALRAIRR